MPCQCWSHSSCFLSYRTVQGTSCWRRATGWQLRKVRLWSRGIPRHALQCMHYQGTQILGCCPHFSSAFPAAAARHHYRHWGDGNRTAWWGQVQGRIVHHGSFTEHPRSVEATLCGLHVAGHPAAVRNQCCECDTGLTSMWWRSGSFEWPWSLHCMACIWCSLPYPYLDIDLLPDAGVAAPLCYKTSHLPKWIWKQKYAELNFKAFPLWLLFTTLPFVDFFLQ